MLLVILGFTQLTSLYSLVSLSNLGFTQLNSVNISVSSESLCNPWFNSVKLGLFFGQFQCNFYSVNTPFMLTKEGLALTKVRFMHTKSPYDFLVNSLGYTQLDLINC